MAISEFRSREPERSAHRTRRKLTTERQRRIRPWHYALGVVVLLAAAVGAGVIALASSSASLTADSSALAKVSMPLGGGQIKSVFVTGRDNRPIPVNVRGLQIWPTRTIPAHERLLVSVVVKRGSLSSIINGSTERLSLSLLTPSASLRQHYLTIRSSAPLRLTFKQPIALIKYGTPGAMRRRVLTTPQSVITLGHVAPAGSMTVEASLRSWETARPALISWFPAGAGASAVATPAPGTVLKPTTPITLTFNKPVGQALGSARPPVSPITAGSWRTINSHAIRFVPTGYGYGLSTPVSIGLPHGVQLVGGKQTASSTTGTWSVPAGSTLRLQQLLSMLGYLPLSFKYAGSGVDLTPAAEEAAAVDPPKGSFSWRWSNTPSALKNMWQAGTSGEMTKGAIMAFENNNDMTADGIPGQQVWKLLIAAVLKDQKSTFGYTFVQVSEGSPEGEQTWHNGRTVVSGAVNTGVAAAPTAQGVFTVFEHALSVTMEGTNPDGSHYDDPGVPYVSYFNGGDALHGFIRASYGFPQSDGCVEMPYSEASQVYPYTPIGTLVDVS